MPDGLVTLLDHVRYALTRLNGSDVVVAHGTSDPLAEAVFLVCETLHLSPDQFEPFAMARLTSDEHRKVLELVEARITTRKPAAYLHGVAWLRGLRFRVDERVIVPRSYLAEIIEEQVAGDDGGLIDDPGAVTRILELCTGSGCLSVIAARAFPNAQIDAADLSKDALSVARQNVAAQGLAERIRLLQGDLYAPVKAERYDLIIANPPYVDAGGMAALPAECRHEPAMAFDGGADGIDLVRRIIDGAASHLNDGGALICEVGRCRPQVEEAYPDLDLLWLDSAESEGEVFWMQPSA